MTLLPSLFSSSLMAPWSPTKSVTSQSTVGDSDDSLDGTRLFDGKTEGSSDESKLGSSMKARWVHLIEARLLHLTGGQMVRDSVVQLWEMLWEIS